jgi:hypothetical protein
MLRSGDTIRLTPSEKEYFSLMAADSSKAPTTVQEHDARLDLAAETWDQSGSSEGQLMASLAKSLKIVPDKPKAVIALVLTPLEQLQKDVSTMWEVDASKMSLAEMLKLAEDSAVESRNPKLPEASRVFEVLAQEIRDLMARE